MEFKSDTQIANYYAPDAFRSSDHDPLVVALNLVPESTNTGGSNNGQPNDGTGTDDNTGNSGGSLSSGLLMFSWQI